MFGDFFWKIRPENCPKTAWKTGQNHPKIPPEALPEDPEIANKPVSFVAFVQIPPQKGPDV